MIDWIQGTVRLKDGTKSHFTILPDAGWQQYGADARRVGVTVDLMEALASATLEANVTLPCPACVSGRLDANEARDHRLEVEEEDEEGTTLCPYCEGTEEINDPDDYDAAQEYADATAERAINPYIEKEPPMADDDVHIGTTLPDYDPTDESKLPEE